MENQNQDENTSPYSGNIDKALWREQKYTEIVNELNNNPEVQQMKEKYDLSSVESFIGHYAWDKVRILEWGSINEGWDDELDLQWVSKAYEGLCQIQQKKLFDLQCLWRAGVIDLEGVLISYDFYRWELDIMNCPFIPPISQNEVDLYILYLQSTNYEEIDDIGAHQWQDHREIIEAYNSDNQSNNFPEWYDFYNGRMGTGVYMTFPDIRGPKEDFYLNLFQEFKSLRQLAESKKQDQTVPETNRLPWLYAYNADQLSWFVSTFEDKQTQEFASLCGAFRDSDDFDIDWDTDKQQLSSTADPIPVLPWHNWREALHRSAEWYKRKKIIEAMAVAYESYCIRRDAGIPFEKDTFDPSLEELLKKARQKIIDSIVEGRQLYGESPDLDF